MNDAIARAKDRMPGELSDLDKDILGSAAVRIAIPCHDITEAKRALGLVISAAERARVILDHTKLGEERSGLFQAKALLRSCHQTISKRKRKAW